MTVQDNTNYARDFKIAYESRDLSQMVSIVEQWEKKQPDEANFYLAAILLMNEYDEDANELFDMFKFAVDKSPEDEELYLWYVDAAVGVLNQHSDELLQNDPDASRIIVEAKSVDVSQNDEDDDGFAMKFLMLCKEFEECEDYEKLEHLHSQMEDILEKWGEKYPEDANFTCAYIILNITELSDDELSELQLKATSQTPIDEECSVYLLGNMNQLAMIRNGDDEDNDFLKDLISPDEDSSSDGEKTDFAAEFMDCYREIEATDDSDAEEKFYEIMTEILEKWEVEYPDDANFTCAYIMINVLNFSNDEILDLIVKLLSQTPVNEKYHGEYMEAMRRMVELKREYETSTLDDISDLEVEQEDKGYAKAFLECFNRFEELDDSTQYDEIYAEMSEILKSWQDEFPNDANCVCANVIMNVVDLSDDDISAAMFKINHMDAIDEESHEILVHNMNRLISMRGSLDDSSDDDKQTVEVVDGDIDEEEEEINYAEEFLVYINTFNRIDDLQEQKRIHEEMIEFVDEWGRKYPTDANYTLAYITANVLTMEEDDIKRLLSKYPSQIPGEPKYRKRIYSICKDILDDNTEIDIERFIKI